MKRLVVVSLAGALMVAALPAAGHAAPRAGLQVVSVQLGLRLVPTTEQLRRTLGVEAARGALVLEVEPKGPADAAGLRAGDVVTRVAGQPVSDAAEVLDAVEGRRPGDTVPVEYVRDHRTETATVRLARGRGDRLRMGRWSVPIPEMPERLERELRSLRERFDRQLRELDERLRRLEEDGGAERTAL